MKKILRRFLAAGAASGALIGCTALLGDFEVNPSSSSGGGDGDTDGTSGEASAGDGGGDSATPLICNAPYRRCPGTNTCVLAATDGEHCGECGHSCGGGACENGLCRPAKIFELGDAGPLSVGAMDVSEDHVLFTTSDGNQENKMLRCPLTGCKGPPQQLAVMQYAIDAIASVNKDTFAFLSAPTQSTQRPAVFACTPAGCQSPPVSFAADGLNGLEARLRTFGNRIFHHRRGTGLGFSDCLTPGTCTTPPTEIGNPNTRGTHGFTADTSSVYFIDSSSRGSTIARCAQNDAACVPATIVSGDASEVQSVEFEAGRLAWIRPGRDGFDEGKLFACDLPACASPKIIANGLSTSPNAPIELRVDASGAYWITTTKKIQRCAPNDCLGGAKDFVVPLTAPHSLVPAGKFVYWAEKTAIWRLAK